MSHSKTLITMLGYDFPFVENETSRMDNNVKISLRIIDVSNAFPTVAQFIYIYLPKFYELPDYLKNNPHRNHRRFFQVKRFVEPDCGLIVVIGQECYSETAVGLCK